MSNNPLNFTDPTGHKEDGACGYNGDECHTDYDEDAHDNYVPSSGCGNYCTPPENSNDGGNRRGGTGDNGGEGAESAEDPIIGDIMEISWSKGVVDYHLVIFPPGAPTTGVNTDPDQVLANYLSVLGIDLDIVEMGAAGGVITEPAGVVAGIADWGVTGAACGASGECYLWDSPGGDLPNMAVANQDFIANGAEAVVGPLGGPVGDVITSGISALHDTLRLVGWMPNLISVGVTVDPGRTYRPQVYYLVFNPFGP